MEKKRYKSKSFVCLACLVVMLLSLVLSIGAPMIAYADTSLAVSNVLDDLRKDDTFDVGYYPMNSKDYTISVIQVAETTSKELFVYVYQPSGSKGSIIASSINIAETDSLDFKNYKLKLLNSSGVFYKYVVQDYTVSNNTVRYYYISSIFRPYIENVDKDVENGNTVSEVAFAVAKEYRFTELNGQLYCDAFDIETIEITDKFVGFVRYSNGYFLFGSGSCDSHFIAFSTDRSIDTLLEADVYYTSQRYIIHDNAPYVDWFLKDTINYYEKKENYVSLTYKDKASSGGNGWGAVKYTWDRIETVEQFLKENDVTKNVYSGAVFNKTVANRITSEGKKALENKQWVLRFAETSYSVMTAGQSFYDISGTMVGDVSILRLKFETEGKIYNLGVIDNKQIGSDKPINVETVKVKIKSFMEFIQWLVDHTGIPAWFWIALIILIPIAIVSSILSVFFPPVRLFFSTVFKVLWRGIKALAKALWWLIKLPIKGIKMLIEKIKERRS